MSLNVVICSLLVSEDLVNFQFCWWYTVEYLHVSRWDKAKQLCIENGENLRYFALGLGMLLLMGCLLFSFWKFYVFSSVLKGFKLLIATLLNNLLSYMIQLFSYSLIKHFLDFISTDSGLQHMRLSSYHSVRSVTFEIRILVTQNSWRISCVWYSLKEIKR